MVLPCLCRGRVDWSGRLTQTGVGGVAYFMLWRAGGCWAPCYDRSLLAGGPDRDTVDPPERAAAPDHGSRRPHTSSPIERPSRASSSGICVPAPWARRWRWRRPRRSPRRRPSPRRAAPGQHPPPPWSSWQPARRSSTRRCARRRRGPCSARCCARPRPRGGGSRRATCAPSCAARSRPAHRR